MADTKWIELRGGGELDGTRKEVPVHITGFQKACGIGVWLVFEDTGRVTEDGISIFQYSGKFRDGVKE